MHQLAERLRAERERQRRTLRDLSAETKIREPFLAAIERGDFDVLPQVYVRSFVKTYASALGLTDAQITVMLSDALTKDEHEDAPSPRRKRASTAGTSVGATPPAAESLSNAPGTSWRTTDLKLGNSIIDVVRSLPYWVWIALGLLLSAIVVALVVGSDADKPQPAGESTVVNVEATAAVQDSMILRAEVMDTAWISITADGTSSYQTVLLPGISAQWSAMDRFEISMGNAGGVVFYRDEQRLPAFAGSKQSVRKVVVTRTSVVTPSTAWQEQPPAPAASAPSASAESKPLQPSRKKRPAASQPQQVPAITPVQPR